MLNSLVSHPTSEYLGGFVNGKYYLSKKTFVDYEKPINFLGLVFGKRKKYVDSMTTIMLPVPVLMLMESLVNDKFKNVEGWKKEVVENYRLAYLEELESLKSSGLSKEDIAKITEVQKRGFANFEKSIFPNVDYQGIVKAFEEGGYQQICSMNTDCSNHTIYLAKNISETFMCLVEIKAIYNRSKNFTEVYNIEYMAIDDEIMQAVLENIGGEHND